MKASPAELGGLPFVLGWAERGISQRNGNGTVYIRDNKILGPDFGARNAINLSGGNGSEVTGNTIQTSSFGQEDWSGTGILLMGTVNALIQGNTIENAEDVGIAIAGYPAWSNLDENWTDASGNVIEGNTLTGSGSAIAIAGQSTNTLIRGNLIQQSDRGINEYPQLEGVPSGTRVETNTIRDNEWGIRVSSALEGNNDYELPMQIAEDNIFQNNAVFQVADFSWKLDLELALADNSFDRAVVVRENPIVVPAIFSTIQGAVNVAAPGDTVSVASGQYEEQVVVNQDLSLIGAEGATILGPEDAELFSIPEQSSAWQPIVFAFGGTLDEGEVSGPETISLDISGFIIDGQDLQPDGQYAGVLVRNVDGFIENLTVERMYQAQSLTFGIMAYGDSLLGIMDNDVSGYARCGICANGNSGVSPAPDVLISGNTVTGPGFGQAITSWAPNGIQVAWGATGSVIENTVSGNSHPNAAPGGILVAASSGVSIEENFLFGNDDGIQTFGDFWFDSDATADEIVIRGNTIENGDVGISVGGLSSNLLIELNTMSGHYAGIETWSAGETIDGLFVENNTFMNNVLQVDDFAEVLNLDDSLDGNEFDRAVVVRDNPIVVPVIFSSIQDGIDTAVSGNTVAVSAGTYQEPLARFKSDLTLVGEGSGEVIIDVAGSSSNRGIDVGGSLASSLDNITLEGFTVRNSDPDNFGLKVEFVENLVLRDVVASDNGRTGIDLGPVTNALLENVAASSNGGAGIAFRDISDVTAVSLATADNAWGGLALWAPDGEMLENVSISNSSFAGETNAGIFVQHSGSFVNISVTNNDFSNNGAGLVIDDSFGTPDVSGFSVNHNSISGNGLGVVNDGMAMLDATCNWWGDQAGPSGEGGGQGDTVSDLVEFMPWKTAEGGDCDGVAAFAAGVIPASATLIFGESGQPVDASDLPTVRVVDQYGNGFGGVTVGFEITSGSGSLSGTTRVSDVDGFAQIGSWTLGSESSQAVIAEAPGLDGSPVEFMAEVDAVVELEVSVTDGRDTIEPGERNTYVIVVSNSGPNDAENVEVLALIPEQKVQETADWVCYSGLGASCAESGTGDIDDDSVMLEAGTSVTYVLEADVAENAGGTIEMVVEVTFGDETVSDSTVTDIVITEDSIFRDRFEEDAEAKTVQLDSQPRIQGHIEVDEGFRSGLPPRHLLVASDEAGNKVFRVRTLYFDGQTRSRVEVSDSHGGWSRSEWLQLDPAAQGMIGFDYDAEWGQLIVAGYTQHVDVQARGEASRVHSLSTDHPEEVAITIYQ